jgi:Protein of unknown function (DUF3304)
MNAIRTAMCAIALLALTACRPTNEAVATAPQRAASEQVGPSVPTEREPNGMPKRYSVVAYGYNYTDTYIDSFEVDGAGGGNLAVSTPTAPGGGHTCCMTLVSGLPLGTEFKIKWTRDRKRWCEQIVKLTSTVPIDPRYFEVHFYADGHIEVEATQQASAPRLQLDRFSRGERHEAGNINNDEKFARCTDGRR